MSFSSIVKALVLFTVAVTAIVLIELRRPRNLKLRLSHVPNNAQANRNSSRKSYGDVAKAPVEPTKRITPLRPKEVACPVEPPGLVGKIKVDENVHVDLDAMRKENKDLEEGGHFRPLNCTPQSSIAVIIPFRDREAHLKVFLHYMLPMFKRQLLEFRIYVIEQADKRVFNRGAIFNVGFIEAMKDMKYGCVALHDVDLIAENDHNMYACPGDKPLHLSALIHRYGHEWRPYYSNFGGAAILTTDQYKTVDGFSNVFWGWGGEDDDMNLRLARHKVGRKRLSESLGVYTMLVQHHTRAPGNKKGMDLAKSGPQRYDYDGLHSVKYKVVERVLDRLYTRIKVELGDMEVKNN
ncbi:beta-1,4-galactosyltransferase 2-like [Oscarella lobularis]|uniref:beta-1,4-galactosyltransferase 2-like n=1 Tax=Oscarella lobularis TaxID=121494 RepID=UPI00331323FA